MDRGNIKFWECVEDNKNMLLFAELVKELLFDYSIPSNRIRTLNSHFLCEDALSAIGTIVNNGVPSGTLTPIFDELQHSLKNDIVFKLANEPADKYLLKNNNGVWQVINTNNSSYEDKALCINAIYEKYFSGNWYIDNLKKFLFEKIMSNNEEDWDDIFKLTKLYITEIVNCGYSASFVFEQVNSIFFSKNHINKETASIFLRKFLDSFDFKEKDYIVAFKVPTELIEILKISDDIQVTEDTYKSNETFFNCNANEDLIYQEISALDHFVALSFAKRGISSQIAAYLMYKHDCTVRVEDCNFLVFSEKKKKWYSLCEEKNILQKTRTTSLKKVTEKIKEYNTALAKLEEKAEYYERRSLHAAVEFHYLAACTGSPENQLLDMWSIFENLLDISNKHTSDRIEQISSYLIPILKRKYIYSLFQQLCQDIKTYSLEIFKSITGRNVIDDESIKNLCYFVILPEKKQQREVLCNQLADFPLLRERIRYYEKVLNTKYGIINFIGKHSDMVKWQIMRIYRNRNLIIHNGKSMRYLTLLVENLHDYVDVFLNHVIKFIASDGTLAEVKNELFMAECEWNNFKNKQSDVNVEMIDYILSM